MKKLGMLLLLTSTAVLSGCWGEKQIEQQKEEELTVTAKEKKSEYIYPLTGETSDSAPQHRAAAIVINNHPKARPQTGLADADLVYEVLAEGNVTRFLAFYQSEQPEIAGPVRSARDYFIELAKGYESLFIAHGYSPEARDMLFNGDIDQVNGIQNDGTIFKRDPSRVAPHNSYAELEGIYEKADESGFELNVPPDSLSFLTKSEVKELTGQAADRVQVNYSEQAAFQVEYQFNSKSGSYERYAGGQKAMDRETGEAIQAKNILIIEADHRVIDAEGRLDIDLTSGGDAYFLQDGWVQSVEWSNVRGRILPFKEENSLGFIPGKTWINIIPASKGLTKMVNLENN
ncbi:hypothetical protein JOC78_003165 [Bacillus ectoiniformans]|uniref:DUF3048 domain-containing protein n=1 Tax=Bacillus ectoiniformans TaxID=1494429 RepID=UPI00195873EC|nr:DUF3048 domain-containing protein [Bacillus ectoiniformans]MBM7650181.1 hypothetical protein [Bacillus ectoiniformans]